MSKFNTLYAKLINESINDRKYYYVYIDIPSDEKTSDGGGILHLKDADDIKLSPDEYKFWETKCKGLIKEYCKVDNSSYGPAYYFDVTFLPCIGLARAVKSDDPAKSIKFFESKLTTSDLMTLTILTIILNRKIPGSEITIAQYISDYPNNKEFEGKLDNNSKVLKFVGIYAEEIEGGL